jgi:hypothetical protein
VLWYGTVAQARVTQDGKLRFIFKDEIEIGLPRWMRNSNSMVLTSDLLVFFQNHTSIIFYYREFSQ